MEIHDEQKNKITKQIEVKVRVLKGAGQLPSNREQFIIINTKQAISQSQC